MPKTNTIKKPTAPVLEAPERHAYGTRYTAPTAGLGYCQFCAPRVILFNSDHACTACARKKHLLPPVSVIVRKQDMTKAEYAKYLAQEVVYA